MFYKKKTQQRYFRLENKACKKIKCSKRRHVRTFNRRLVRERKNEWVTANEQIWWCDKQMICKYEETFRHTKKDKNKNASCLKGCTETHQNVPHTKAKTI